MKDFLQIENLTKSYNKETILNRINCSIAKGEFIVLLGPSGCGKSTLLNCITGLIPFETGTISINGKEMNPISPANRNIAMVFQSYALYPNMNVRKNISFGMEIRKTPKAVIDQKVEQVAELLKIRDHLQKKPAHLSGGQRQRVAIARALVRKPDIFLFDEPLSNLDAKLRVNMRTELKKLHKKLAATIIYVTHDQIEALTLANRIAVMLNGEIVQFDTPNEIYHHPINTFVAKFIGTPVINILPATLVRKDGTWKLKIYPLQKNTAKSSHAADDFITLPIPTYLSEHDKKLEQIVKEHDGKVLLGIRPEAISYATQLPNDAVPATISAEVDVVVPSGADTFIVCRVLGHEITARAHSKAKLATPSSTQTDKTNFITLDIDLNQALLFNSHTENRIL
ncbi:ABC transporter ATP-binding protein [Spirochaetota bacterium]|nr:ABC transporter ATP-binding protein [Spirochaetota bacterium]